MNKKNLTGWLILLIIWIGVFGINALATLGRVEDVWKPHMADYPRLRTAVTMFQFIVGAGVVTWMYTAWVLFQREPGSLRRALTSFLVGAILRTFGGWSIVLFGGLPSASIHELIPALFLSCLYVILFTGVWASYLVRSKRVREIYTDNLEIP